MVYCWKCSRCGAREENTTRETPFCPNCTGSMVRDYKTENAAPAVTQLKREREVGGRAVIRDKFLPTTKDFAHAGDPDGEHGMRGWLEEHAPRDSNKRPMYPEHQKRSF